MDQLIKYVHDIYTNGEHLEQDIIDAGFVDVSVTKVKIDIGNWRGCEHDLIHIKLTLQ
jgi:hypothetical protein